MSQDNNTGNGTELEELNDQGAGLGANSEPNSFEPEEEPDATEPTDGQ